MRAAEGVEVIRIGIIERFLTLWRMYAQHVEAKGNPRLGPKLEEVRLHIGSPEVRVSVHIEVVGARDEREVCRVGRFVAVDPGSPGVWKIGAGLVQHLRTDVVAVIPRVLENGQVAIGLEHGPIAAAEIVDAKPSFCRDDFKQACKDLEAPELAFSIPPSNSLGFGSIGFDRPAEYPVDGFKK